MMSYPREPLGLGLDTALSRRQKTLILSVFAILLILLILSVFYGPPLLWLVFSFAIIAFWIGVLYYVSSKR
jgi:hypothetical protein